MEQLLAQSEDLRAQLIGKCERTKNQINELGINQAEEMVMMAELIRNKMKQFRELLINETKFIDEEISPELFKEVIARASKHI